MRSAVFCMVCCSFVFDMVGHPMVLPYSSVVLVIAAYVFINASSDLLQLEVASVFNIFVVFFALYVVFYMCFENVCLGSNVNPNICMSLFVRTVVLLIVWLSVLLDVR